MLDSIGNTVALHHIDYNEPIHLQVDASKLGVGGVLLQTVNLKYIRYNLLHLLLTLPRLTDRR